MTTQQLTLDDFAHHSARTGDPDTSIQAAAARLAGKATDRLTALNTLHWASEWQEDGLTDFELAFRMHRQQTSAGKRRGELRDMGLVEDSGLRRPCPSGSSAIVWRITQKGRDVLAALEQQQ